QRALSVYEAASYATLAKCAAPEQNPAPARGRYYYSRRFCMQGLYFEELKVGHVIEHPIRRTVTEMDNTLFSCLTHNPQPLHIDHHFAAASEWGRPLVNSIFTLGLMIGISVNDTTIGTTIGNLGMTDVKFPKPVFHGDTLHATTEIVSKRKSRSR